MKPAFTPQLMISRPQFSVLGLTLYFDGTI